MTALSSQSPNPPNLNIALVELRKYDNLCWCKLKAERYGIYDPAVPPCKSAEVLPSAGMQQKMLNQQAWEWLTWILKYLIA